MTYLVIPTRADFARQSARITNPMTEGTMTVGELGPFPFEGKFACFVGERRCKHFAYHDFHYPYCSRIPSSSNDGSSKFYAYPWAGAGTHIHRVMFDTQECPGRKFCPISPTP